MDKKKTTLFPTIFLLGLFFSPLQGSTVQDLKLRFFEGTREGKVEVPEVVISSYLHPTVTASIQSKYELSEEIKQIKRVFNLKEVSLITEADLRWAPGDQESIFHIFRLDSREYQVLITPALKTPKYKIEIFEQSKKTKNSLLDTEIILPERNIAVFGFEDKQGKLYFISFHQPEKASVAVGVGSGVEGGVKGGVGSEQRDVFYKDAVRAVGDIKPPVLINKVEPAYPEEARKGRVEGVVIIEAVTDREGNVVSTRVLKSKDEFLSQAAVAAVTKWKYKSLFIDDKPRGVIFTVTVRFKLSEEEEKGIEAFRKGADEAKGEIKPPKLLNKVDPVYPKEARRAGVDGIVLLEARANENGDVEAVRVLKSESTLLNDAAIDAVRKWKYEPYYRDGKAHKIVFTVTVRFLLKDKAENDLEKEAVKIEGDLEPPKLLKKVDPVYPEEARKALISGVVILNVTTDIQGKVIKTKVLKSPDPVLEQAAVDAVKQWVYEPLVVEGKLCPAVFTVTVNFRLK